ncbi:MAG: phage tail assembly chaperone [Pseudomonadota bacterium]
MQLGLGVLRLSPRDFWAMTPRELTAAAGLSQPTSAGRLGRSDLARLMQAYPDATSKHAGTPIGGDSHD